MRGLILGVETSCDDTSVAIVSEEGEVLANVVSSQLKEHAPYMGVVPELASRAHLQNLPTVFASALKQAGCSLEELTAVAVTTGPGLVGSLMVGVSFAKALAFGRNLPLLAVNHIRGHVAALFLEYGSVTLPALALIVSGGHTHLFLVQEDGDLTLLTKTRDDAAGEAFDKLSKMLGLGFPGGPLIDKLAATGNPKKFAFSQPRFNDGSKDYSFSGLKTAAARHLERDPRSFNDIGGQNVRDLCASFQAAVVRQLLDRLDFAIEKEKPATLMLGGGVACNSALKKAFKLLGDLRGLPALVTSPELSTDNAAMIAAEGWNLYRSRSFADFEITADIRFKPYNLVRLL